MAAAGGAGAPLDSSMDESRGAEIVVVLPSYRVKPPEEKKFRPSQAREICEAVVTAFLADKAWSGEGENVWASEITQEIRRRVKAEMDIPRYKVVVQVVIGEVRGQTVRVASRSLWDTDTDNYASFSWKNETLWCTAMVFGLYTE